MRAAGNNGQGKGAPALSGRLSTMQIDATITPPIALICSAVSSVLLPVVTTSSAMIIFSPGRISKPRRKANDYFLPGANLEASAQGHLSLVIPLGEKRRDSKLPSKLVRDDDAAHRGADNGIDGELSRRDFRLNPFRDVADHGCGAIGVLKEARALEVLRGMFSRG
jgi:hypothetical protein